MTIKELLIESGLDDKEADIYLALLSLGEATVLEISKKAGVKRPSTYVNLEGLEQKGFVTRVLQNKKTLYRARNPRNLLTKAEEHLKSLTSVMPQLDALFKNEGGKPKVTFFEGKAQLDTVYDDLFSTRGEALFISSSQFLPDFFPETMKRVGQLKLSEEFSFRELVDGTGEGEKYRAENEGEYRKIRLIPQEFLPFEGDIGIFGNRVLISQVAKEYFTISIESEELARAFRTLFEGLWRLSSEELVI